MNEVVLVAVGKDINNDELYWHFSALRYRAKAHNGKNLS
jgi:hypothetical protein